MDNIRRNFFTVNTNFDIEYYACDINLKNLKQVKDSIDNWSGKGELKVIKAHDITLKKDKVYEIVSKEFLETVKCFDGCCGFNDVDFYIIKYYEYQRHNLSIMCDKIINISDEIELSYLLRSLIEWDSEDILEMQFVKQVLQSLSLTKHNIDSKLVSQLFDEKLVTSSPWLNTSLNKSNIMMEFKKLFMHNENIFFRNKIKRLLRKNLPFSIT